MGKVYRPAISPEEIELLPLADFTGSIVVVERQGKLLDEAVDYLKHQKIVGFDTETKPNFHSGEKRNGVALLQLSGEERAYLFRTCTMGLDDRVAAILSDSGIVKVGAAVRDDINGLRRIRDFSPEAFVDLQSEVKEYGITDLSVKKMAAIVLGVKISKAQRLSNWEAKALTSAQSKYAAIDAWICREIYLTLEKD